MILKRKLFIIISATLFVSILIGLYFLLRPPQTLADIVGRHFMNPDQIITLDGSNGETRELKDNDRAEMLELLQKAKIQNIESIDIMDGSSYIQFLKDDDRFTLDIAGEYCFRISDPNDLSQLIVYHVDKESYKKIRELMKLSF